MTAATADDNGESIDTTELRRAAFAPYSVPVSRVAAMAYADLESDADCANGRRRRHGADIESYRQRPGLEVAGGLTVGRRALVVR